jgi:hypothetical protein
MRFAAPWLSIVLMLATADAAAACATMRVGYPDQNRPPYYLGTGSSEANPPGASIELLREIAASADCPMVTSRMPLLRLRVALEAGQLDAVPIEANDSLLGTFALPVDKRGKLDTAKAIHNYTVVYVRAADHAAASVDTENWLRTHGLGTIQGTPFAAILRARGMTIDDGAVDYMRNLEKLKRGRFDGFIVSVIEPDDLDAFVATHFGKELLRLEQPMRTARIWLAFNKDYYAVNKAHVEAMWNWIGNNAQARLAVLQKKYESPP